MPHIRNIFIIPLVLLLISPVKSQNIIINGDFKNGTESWSFGGEGSYANYSIISDSVYTGIQSNSLKIEIFTVPPEVYTVQLLQRTNIPLNRNDVLFLTFRLKNPRSDVTVVLQRNGIPYDKYVRLDIPPSNEMADHRIAITGSLHDFEPDSLHFGFFFGTGTGEFEISDISFLNLGTEADINQLNADIIYDPIWRTQTVSDEWRTPAITRIKNIRKSPLTVKCVDSNGNPMQNIPVRFRQISSLFHFGTAVKAKLFGGEEYNKTYIEKVESLFNMVTIEDRLKWESMEISHPSVDNVFEWANNRNIPVRGHNLFWPAYRYCPDWLKNLSSSEIRDAVISHIKEYSLEFRGKVIHWDVVNEALTNKELWQPHGITFLKECYTSAKENDPGAVLFYNDYNLLVNNSQTMENLINLITEMKNLGTPVEALGIQGHMDVSTIVTPENALKNLNMLSSLGLPFYITELDIDTVGDKDLHAAYLKDILIALFSHPSVKGIIQWGFWEGTHWQPERALYNLDWTPRPAGAVYEDLVINEWRTDSQKNTNTEGTAVENCFHGNYEITTVYENHGKITYKKDTVSVMPEEENSIITGINSPDDSRNDSSRNNRIYNIYNYPNPFNSYTKIYFSQKSGSSVYITIYDVNGKKIKKLSNPVYQNGQYVTEWNGRNNFGKKVSSGVYFFILDSDGRKTVKKCILLN